MFASMSTPDMVKRGPEERGRPGVRDHTTERVVGGGPGHGASPCTLLEAILWAGSGCPWDSLFCILFGPTLKLFFFFFFWLF